MDENHGQAPPQPHGADHGQAPPQPHGADFIEDYNNWQAQMGGDCHIRLFS